MAPRNRELHTPASESFQAPLYLDSRERLVAVAADGLPFLQWPDGSWCFEGNRFIRELFDRGLKRKPRGGSLAIAAGQISHLLRYCWSSRIHPLSLSDNEFSTFIGRLITEADPRQEGARARNCSTVIDIGRRCLEFLCSVGHHSGNTQFVGASGQIRANRRTLVVRTNGRNVREGKRTLTYWHHSAFPQPDPKSARGPIAKACIDKLRASAIDSCRQTLQADRTHPAYVTLHKRDRRLTSLLLLECTGGRRYEVVLLKVESVRQAERMSSPMLEVQTVKKKTPVKRLVPISRVDLKAIVDYIDYSRNPLLRKLAVPDHGFLLVSSVTGLPIAANTLTNEVRDLAILAGITEKASPHLFRHRFITKVFVRLIEQHQLENPDQLRRLLLDAEGLKRKVMELTGHTSLASVENYIHMAFDEVSSFGRTYNVVSGSLVVDAAITAIESQIRLYASEQSDATDRATKWTLDFLKALALDLRSVVQSV